MMRFLEVDIEETKDEDGEMDITASVSNEFDFPNNINITKELCKNLTNLSINLTECNIFDDPGFELGDTMVKIIGIVVPIFFGLIVIVGLFGNSLVVIVVLFNPQMRSTTNLLIINLAMADLLFIVFCVPFTALDYVFPSWLFGDAWCRVVQYLVIVCAYASIYTLVLMSLDRFLAVVHPITSMSLRTERNAYIAIFLMWLVILLCCLPAISAHGESVYTIAEIDYQLCGFLSEYGYNHSAFQICFFLSSYVIPLALIFLLYVLMLKRLWFTSAPGGHMSAESVRSKKRVTRMVVIVVVIFAVCWCPIQIVLVMKSLNAYKIDSVTNLIFQIFSQILAYMNSCVNPILYAFLSENFRKAFLKVVGCNTAGRDTRTGRSTKNDTCATGLTKNNNMNNDIA